MKEGQFPTVAELVAGSDAGSLEDYVFNLKSGRRGETGLSRARLQSVTSRTAAKYRAGA